MNRVAMLRAGYAAFGGAFLALGASALPAFGLLLPVGLLLAFLGGVLLAFSGDDLPRWAGLALVFYFVMSLIAFLAATPITVRLDFFKGFLNANPSPLAQAIFEYLVLALPLMMGATAVAAAWEREWPPRLLLLGSIAGFVLVALLTVVLVPRGADATDVAAATGQANLLRVLFGVSALAGAAGALWAAQRPDEYA